MFSTILVNSLTGDDIRHTHLGHSIISAEMYPFSARVVFTNPKPQKVGQLKNDHAKEVLISLSPSAWAADRGQRAPTYF